MLTKITLALAFLFAVIQAVPASAGPTTCGSSTFQYDSWAPRSAPTVTKSSGARSVLLH